jgi:hypothetical protein
MGDETASRPTESVKPLPAGYRQGLISAITVLIGFSLLFVRYWTFEAEGEWSIASSVSAALLVIAVGLEFVALWRSLLPRDDDEPVYYVTLRWFFSSVLVLAVAVLLSALIAARILR